MRHDIDAAVEALARSRGGVFTRAEVAAAGGDRALIHRRRRSGRWEVLPGDVLRLSAASESLDQRRWHGLLAGGPAAHLSHETAGQLQRMESSPRDLVVVTVDHPMHLRIPGVTYHQLADVAPHHLAVVQGFPTTTPARTLVDLAAVVGPIRLQHAVEESVVRGSTNFGEVAAVLAEVRRRGKPGVRKLMAVLETLAGEAPPESELERLLWMAVTRSGVVATRQHPLPSRMPTAEVVDVAIPASRLILEADGRRWHARHQAMGNDRRRDREAARAGWQTLRFVHEDLRDDLAGCVDDILTVHRERSTPRAS